MLPGTCDLNRMGWQTILTNDEGAVGSDALLWFVMGRNSKITR